MTFNTAEWFSNRTITEFTYRGLVNILPLLDDLGIRATFFVTGSFANKETDIVREIYEHGHEVGCHSLVNESHSNFSAEKTFDYLKKSKEILETITKEGTQSLRMPFFAANKYHLGIASSLGFSYDSSSHPALLPGKLRNFLKRKRPYYIKSLDLQEVPVTVFPFIQTPVSSAFMRNFGNIYTAAGIELRSINCDEICMYFYPWEFISLKKMKGNPFYTRNTGVIFRRQFIEMMNYYKKMHCKFKVMREF